MSEKMYITYVIIKMQNTHNILNFLSFRDIMKKKTKESI